MSTGTLRQRQIHPTAHLPAPAPERGRTLRFALLGPVEVVEAGRPVTPRAHKLRVLLATLVVCRNTVVSVDSLIRELWDETPPRTSLQALRVYISQLRQLLGAVEPRGPRPVLITQPPGYRIDVDPGLVDVFEFERLYEQAQIAQHKGLIERSAQLYRSALDLWRGPALQDVRSGLTLDGAALRLEEAWIAALERRIDVDLLLNRHLDLVAELRALTTEHPFNEGLHARLMVALYRSGRTSDALQVYRGVRETLIGELGVEPNRGLQRVHQAVLSADHEALDRFDNWTL